MSIDPIGLVIAFTVAGLFGGWIGYIGGVAEGVARERLRQDVKRSHRPASVLSRAVLDVLAERQRQISVEGWTPEHDDGHDTEELAFAASCYATADEGEAPPAVWPWDWSWWKPKGRRRNLVKAGALILAEIDRLDRKDSHEQ
ncbi:hypothetical protein [Chryseobacterium sp.]|uniref:hypothetical protein n=1 Tax=Chryseobacterium sp. TaxID=1871047 RepID=UPI00321AA25E